MSSRRLSLIVFISAVGVLAVFSWLAAFANPPAVSASAGCPGGCTTAIERPQSAPAPLPRANLSARQSSASTTIRCVQAGNAACYDSIDAALTAAQVGDVIRVATGIYTGFVTITKTVTLEGGWNASFTGRDPQANPTVLRPANASFSVVYIQGKNGEPGAVAPTLDGFTITGGGGGDHGGGLRLTDSSAIIRNNVIRDNLGYLLGGGIWVQRGAPLIENNRIENNRLTPGGLCLGAGIELESTQATLRGNVITNNRIDDSAGYGGGVAVEGGGPVRLENNTILSNTAATQAGGASDYSYGGGISARDALIWVSGNQILSNTANSANYGFGGGIYLFNSSAFTLTDNAVLSNTAGYSGGFLHPYLQGGGIFLDSSRGRLTGNRLQGNRANRFYFFGNGGGIAAEASQVTIQGGSILKNSTSLDCEGYGGGLYLADSRLTLDAVRIDQNCAATSPDYGQGGGLALFNTPYTLTNVLLTRNSALNNDAAVGGIYADSQSPGYLFNNTLAANRGQAIRSGSALTLTNNIILSATTGISLSVLVPVSATYNDFYSNIVNLRGFISGTGNLVVDPQLDAGFHLKPGSPLIDRGERANAPLHDFDGEPRPMLGTSGFYRVDIGADEFTGPAQQTIDLSRQPADLTLIGPGNPQDNPGSDGSNDWIGNAVLAGDVNGDQRADLIVGAQNLSSDFSGGVNDDGRIFGLYGGGTRRLGTVDLYTTTANLEIRSWIHQQHIGQSFAAADLNGDQQNDLIIGASGAAGFNVKGSVFIFAGGPELSGTYTLSPTLQASYRILADQNTGSFAGAGELAAGQLDGSGPADLVIGEDNASAKGRSGSGAVYVFFGRQNFPAQWNLQDMPPDLTIDGPAASANLGQVTLADVNGDNRPDLVARSADTIYVFFGPLRAGEIDLASQSADLTLSGLSFGRLAAGDVNGDHKADLIVGDGDQVKVFDGGTLGLLATFSGVKPTALVTLDWNNDGKADIAVGDSFSNRAYLIPGRSAASPPASLLDQAAWVFEGQQPGDQLGFSLGAGDLDTDGATDLILGSRSHVLKTRSDPHFNDAGAVYVFYNNAPIPPVVTPLESVTISGPTSGTLNTLYTFSATISPLTATLPVTYTWDPLPESGQGSPVVGYRWTSSGSQNISVLAANPAGSVSASYSIVIATAPPPPLNHIYAPLLLR